MSDPSMSHTREELEAQRATTTATRVLTPEEVDEIVAALAAPSFTVERAPLEHLDAATMCATIRSAWAERDVARAEAHMRTQEAVAAVLERDEAREWAKETVKAVVAARIVTCVYCGHEYPSGTPATQNAALTAHIAKCSKHPLTAARKRIAALKQQLEVARRGDMFRAGIEAAAAELERAFEESDTLNLLHGVARMRSLITQPVNSTVNDELRSLRAHVERLREALEAVDEWRGLDGDGISDPVRQQVKAALAQPEGA